MKMEVVDMEDTEGQKDYAVEAVKIMVDNLAALAAARAQVVRIIERLREQVTS